MSDKDPAKNQRVCCCRIWLIVVLWGPDQDPDKNQGLIVVSDPDPAQNEECVVMPDLDPEKN